MAVFKYKSMGLAPNVLSTMYKMDFADAVEHGLVDMSHIFSTGKRKHVRGYQKGLLTNRVMKKRARELEHLDEIIQRESRFLVQAKLPLVLNFTYQDNIILPEAMGFLVTDNIHAFWTCYTKVGTIVVAKFDEHDYRAWLMRPYRTMDEITITRTMQFCSDSRAGALAKLCGSPWVYSLGKLYSLYDLYSEVSKEKLRTSVFFKFEDENGQRTVFPKKHVRQIFIDDRNNNAEFVWEAFSQDIRWQPKPHFQKLKAGHFPQPDVPRDKTNPIIHLIKDSFERMSTTCDPTSFLTLRKHANDRVWKDDRWVYP